MNKESSETIQVNKVLGIQHEVPNNLIDLFKDSSKENGLFKEKIIKVFLSLSYQDALKVFKLFEAVPDVKDSWIKFLEIRVERSEKESLELQHQKEIIESLDSELNELLKKHTLCEEENQKAIALLKDIQLMEIENTKDDPSELEADLLNNNEDIMLLIKDFFNDKKKKEKSSNGENL